MRTILTPLLLMALTSSSGQFACPGGFHLVPGGNLDGELDVYTNGKYSFDTHKVFREYDFVGMNDSAKTYLAQFFKFPFYITRDGLCWGTGRFNGGFSYVVADADGELVELYANTKDSGFEYYSKWLLSTARQYKKTGKSLIFPMHRSKR